MRSNYRRIGSCIRLSDERNAGLKVKRLLGLSISKQFIPSVANVIGSDMENYKIIRKNQFACSVMQVRRDRKMPIALLTSVNEAIISQAYPVFEIQDVKKVLPEYLMMWFTRPEFDREACFNAVGGVRGNLEWEDFCDMSVPIPSIAKQNEVVTEYHTIQERIDLNQKIILKLEETVQAIYKQWFVDFEFPNDTGKPYKSSGGEMENSELGEIPVDWKVERLTQLCDVLNGRAYAETEFRDSGTPIIRIQNLSGGSNYVYSDLQLDPDKYVEKDDLIFAWSATFGPFIWRRGKSIFHYHIWKLKCHKPEYKFLLYIYFLRETKRVSGEGTGSIFAHITKTLMESQKVIVPSAYILNSFHEIARAIDVSIGVHELEIEKLEKLKGLLLSKLATIQG
jgi:type I restriction enzyme S subunit